MKTEKQKEKTIQRLERKSVGDLPVSQSKPIEIEFPKTEKQKQGKRNRAQGAAFERRVRADLESKGWIVSKWQNNVECIKYNKETCRDPEDWGELKCIPAKASRFRLSTTGFPDFIAYNRNELDVAMKQIGANGVGNSLVDISTKAYAIIFVEVKTNGYLSKEEKEKAIFYLNNNYCSKFLIASKYKEKGKVKIKYDDFSEKYGKEI